VTKVLIQNIKRQLICSHTFVSVMTPEGAFSGGAFLLSL